jgi:phosphoserine phosphatase
MKSEFQSLTFDPRGTLTMPLSGEAIRLMNYIDDVAVTLRRVLATIPTLTADERARVAEHLLQARPNAEDVAQALKAD